VDGCVPFNRKKTFIARSSKELDARMRAKRARELPDDF
jgi:hypothetical protein